MVKGMLALSMTRIACTRDSYSSPGRVKMHRGSARIALIE